MRGLGIQKDVEYRGLSLSGEEGAYFGQARDYQQLGVGTQKEKPQLSWPKLHPPPSGTYPSKGGMLG